MLNLNRVQTTSRAAGNSRGCFSVVYRMSNKTTLAVYVGFVVAVGVLLLGYWRASTERLILREKVEDQAKIADVAERKLSDAADQLRKQLEEANGQIETLNHEKGELEGKVRDGELVVKEREALKDRFDAVNENLKTEKEKADKLDKEKKILNDEMNTLKSKVTNLSKTLNSTIAKQEAQAALLKEQEAKRAKEQPLQLNDTEPKVAGVANAADAGNIPPPA